MESTQTWASVMKTRPMLFMHFAIGRSDLGFSTLRHPWEHSNTLSVYPIPYYHDMNGRGSTTWMDVVARTHSCWRGGDSVVVNNRQVQVRCRWGTRSYEEHTYTTQEWARMVAHELGHCLGLVHPEPRCFVYPDLASASLMQQQRVLAVQGWDCACLKPTCKHCECKYDLENFANVGKARYLSPQEVALVQQHVYARDSLVSRVSVPGSLLVGPVDLMYEETDRETGLVLVQGHTLVLSSLPFPRTASVVRVNFKLFFCTLEEFTLEVGSVASRSEDNVSTPSGSSTSPSVRVLFKQPWIHSHFELDIPLKALHVQQGDWLSVKLGPVPNQPQARVRIGAHEQGRSSVLVQGEKKEIRGGLLVSYEMA